MNNEISQEEIDILLESAVSDILKENSSQDHYDDNKNISESAIFRGMSDVFDQFINSPKSKNLKDLIEDKTLVSGDNLKEAVRRIDKLILYLAAAGRVMSYDQEGNLNKDRFNGVLQMSVNEYNKGPDNPIRALFRDIKKSYKNKLAGQHMDAYTSDLGSLAEYLKKDYRRGVPMNKMQGSENNHSFSGVEDFKTHIVQDILDITSRFRKQQ